MLNILTPEDKWITNLKSPSFALFITSSQTFSHPDSFRYLLSPLSPCNNKKSKLLHLISLLFPLYLPMKSPAVIQCSLTYGNHDNTLQCEMDSYFPTLYWEHVLDKREESMWRFCFIALFQRLRTHIGKLTVSDFENPCSKGFKGKCSSISKLASCSWEKMLHKSFQMLFPESESHITQTADAWNNCMAFCKGW